MNHTKTERGFTVIEFSDYYGHECSVQASSLVEPACIWLGVTKVNPQVLARDAASVGVHIAPQTGWVPYPIPECVLLTSRMHLSQEEVKDLLPILQHFVDTGQLPDGAARKD